MNIEQAIKILHPDTTRDALIEIEYCTEFDRRGAMKKACDEACIVACEVMQEKLNNENGCNYCLDEKPILQDCDNGYFLEVGKEEISVWDGNACVAVFDAEYCPVCGRKFN